MDVVNNETVTDEYMNAVKLHWEEDVAQIFHFTSYQHNSLWPFLQRDLKNFPLVVQRHSSDDLGVAHFGCQVFFSSYPRMWRRRMFHADASELYTQ